MDIESLKLILESVDGISESAKWIGVLWIAKDYFIGLLWMVGTAISLKFIGVFIVRVVSTASLEGEICSAIGVSEYSFGSYEKRKLLRFLSERREEFDSYQG